MADFWWRKACPPCYLQKPIVWEGRKALLSLREEAVFWPQRLEKLTRACWYCVKKAGRGYYHWEWRRGYWPRSREALFRLGWNLLSLADLTEYCKYGTCAEPDRLRNPVWRWPSREEWPVLVMWPITVRNTIEAWPDAQRQLTYIWRKLYSHSVWLCLLRRSIQKPETDWNRENEWKTDWLSNENTEKVLFEEMKKRKPYSLKFYVSEEENWRNTISVWRRYHYGWH